MSTFTTLLQDVKYRLWSKETQGENRMYAKHLTTITFLLIIGSLMVGCQQPTAATLVAAQEIAQAGAQADGASDEGASDDGAKTTERITGNVVSFDPDAPNSYRAFAPELAASLARMPQPDPETQVYVEEVKPNLFYVTGGVYQSAFLKTTEGVIVFDAPPSFAHKLPAIIAEHAPDVPITHLIYSHGHTDHVGGANVFGDIEGLQVVAPEEVARSIAEEGAPTILLPTMTYEDYYDLTIGGETVELKTAAYHAEDVDAIIYLPKQKFLMAVDTITTGEVPFMNFGATTDVGEYLTMFDELLAYDFDLLLSGHLSVLGTRADVLENQEYTFDVRDTILNLMPTLNERINETFAAFEYENANLAYRSVIEQMRDECSAEIIDRWQDRLSVVDVWADSHCETMILYYIMH